LSGWQDTHRDSAPHDAKLLRIASVKRLKEKSDVWCIHVPDVEHFSLSNGAIVHNSNGADAWRYLAVSIKQPEQAKAAQKSRYYAAGAWS
jgi:hypothetical protein